MFRASVWQTREAALGYQALAALYAPKIKFGASGFVFLLAEFHGSSVMIEINEAGCVVIKLGTSCLFVVDRARCLRRLLVERNVN